MESSLYRETPAIQPDDDCLKCKLYTLCNSPIMPGDGAEQPIFLFVGESPGENEDEYNRPFIGRAGELLREVIVEVGIQLKYCRFSNAVRCHPPDNNLKAYPDAVELCRPKILREIHRRRPKIVVCLGNSAIKSVLNKSGITKLNGMVFEGNGRYYVACAHPAYVLRNPAYIRRFRDAISVARNLLDRVPGQAPTEKVHHSIIYDRQMLKEHTDFLKKQRDLVADIEGSGLSAWDSRVTPRLGCAGFCWEKGHAVLYPMHARIGMKINVSVEEVEEACDEVWRSDANFTMHFGKYDYVYYRKLRKVRMKHFVDDTGLMSYALEPEAGGHGLKNWAWKLGLGGYEREKEAYCAAHPEADPELAGGDFTKVPLPILGKYCLWDNDVAWRLKPVLLERLHQTKRYEKPYRFPIMWHNWTASVMERNGLPLDVDCNNRLLTEFPETIKGFETKLLAFPALIKLEKQHKLDYMRECWERVKNYKRPVKNPDQRTLEIYKKSYEPLNLNSKDLLRELLFNILKLEPGKKTPSGKKFSVDKNVLDDLLKAVTYENSRNGHSKEANEILELVITRNQHDSAYSKYIVPIQKMDGKKPPWLGTDRRTHTTYMVHGQTTGRVGSEKPNHENLPKHSKLAAILREQFCASGPEFFLLEADEKHLEARIFCDDAKDEVMLAEFLRGEDFHVNGASALFRVPPAKVTKEQRQKAKSAVSFGLLYGRTAHALAVQMGWSDEEADELVEAYFEKYWRAREYQAETEQYIVDNEHSRPSHFNRTRRLPGITSDDKIVYYEAVHEGINAPIQGDGSDLTWCAGHRMAEWLENNRCRTQLIITVHDAIGLNVHRAEKDEVVPQLCKYMTDLNFLYEKLRWKLGPPLLLDISVGPNLRNMTECEANRKTGEFYFPANF
jgi:uracil-DNA glycosylase family 4